MATTLHEMLTSARGQYSLRVFDSGDGCDYVSWELSQCANRTAMARDIACALDAWGSDDPPLARTLAHDMCVISQPGYFLAYTGGSLPNRWWAWIEPWMLADMKCGIAHTPANTRGEQAVASTFGILKIAFPAPVHDTLRLALPLSAPAELGKRYWATPMSAKDTAGVYHTLPDLTTVH